MKKSIVLWVTAAVLVLVALYVTINHNKDTNNTVLASPSLNSAGQKAIDFTLTDLDGRSVTLSDLKGKSVYINFWATWCPWCVKELPDIEKVHQQYKDKGLVVLAVDLGEDKDTVKNFISQNKYDFNVLLDSDKAVANAYNISSIPVSVFIDKDGNIFAKRVGALSESEMEQYVKAIMDK